MNGRPSFWKHALGNHRPALDSRSGAVIGTIDVESERANAFSVRDQQLLEECVRTALPLWVRN